MVDSSKKTRKKVSQASVANSRLEDSTMHVTANFEINEPGKSNVNSWIIGTRVTDPMTNDTSKLISIYPPSQ